MLICLAMVAVTLTVAFVCWGVRIYRVIKTWILRSTEHVHDVPLLVIVALALISFPSKAFGYIDPGSGSYLLQIVVTGALGVGFAVKSFWSQIKSYVRGRFSRQG